MAVQFDPANSKTSVSELDAWFRAFKSALNNWTLNHDLLIRALASGTVDGWLITDGGEKLHPSSREALGLIKARMCSLEPVDQNAPFRLVGAISIPEDFTPLVVQANASRLLLDEASAPLRKLRLVDLERVPEATEIEGIQSAHWQELKPSSSVWRAVCAGAGVPRIQIRFAVRPIHLEGVSADAPRMAAFSTTKQCISSRREIAEVRARVNEIYEDDALRSDAARRDLAVLDALAAIDPAASIVYRYFGGEVTHINFAWADGRRRRVTTTLPFFFCSPQISICAPKEKSEKDRVCRSDKKYADRPLLETVHVFTTIDLTRKIYGQYGN